jgi:hypothetical protein
LALAALAGVRGAPWALVAGLALLWLAFGDAGGLYPAIAAVVPPVSASGTPYRFVLGAILAFAVLAARTRAAPWVAALSLMEAAWVDPRPWPFASTEALSHPGLRALRGTAGAVLDLPRVGRACPDEAAHHLAGVSAHGMPSPLLLRQADAAWGDNGERARALDEALVSADCAERLPPLLVGYGAVVVHLHGDCALRRRSLHCLDDVLGHPTEEDGARWWRVPVGGATSDGARADGSAERD